MKIVTAVISILLAAVSAVADDSPEALRGGPSPTTDGASRKLQSRIINGTDAPVDRYPYTVSLQPR